MGDTEPVKEQNDGGSPEPNSRISVGIRSTNQRRRAWKETEQESESGTNRSVAERDIATVERLREAVSRSTPGSKWYEIAIIFGAIMLVASIMLTLVTVLGVNARANRLVENDATRAREGGAVVARLEGKLDGAIATINENNGKLDALANTTTTATTVARNSRSTPTTRARTTPTATTRPTPPTTRPIPPPATTVAPATTSPPCRLALLNLCLAS